MSRSTLIAVLIVAVVAACNKAEPREAYRYIDDQGVPHITNNRDSIPPEYYKSVEIVQLGGEGDQYVSIPEQARGAWDGFMGWLGFGPAEPEEPKRRRRIERDAGGEVLSEGQGGWFNRKGDARFRNQGTGAKNSSKIGKDPKLKTYTDANGRRHYTLD